LLGRRQRDGFDRSSSTKLREVPDGETAEEKGQVRRSLISIERLQPVLDPCSIEHVDVA
jgi:hypothetical protein